MNTNLLVIFLSLFIIGLILSVILISYLSNKRWKYFKTLKFKTAKFSDNIGNDYFVIVGKNKDGNFLELSKFPVVRFKIALTRENSMFQNIMCKGLEAFYLETASQKFLNKEDVEIEFKKFLIRIGQTQYKSEITTFEEEEIKEVYTITNEQLQRLFNQGEPNQTILKHWFPDVIFFKK